MDFTQFKAQMLAPHLWMAETDRDYALWSAKEWETRMPWLLANLERKVAQHIVRGRASAPGADSDRGESGPV